MFLSPYVQLINITARYGAVHFGGFQVELCPQVTETDNCFQTLPMVSSNFRIVNGNRLCVPHEHGIPGGNDVTVMVRLPANVRCNRCTIRFTHRTFYPWSPGWSLTLVSHCNENDFGFFFVL